MTHASRRRLSGRGLRTLQKPQWLDVLRRDPKFTLDPWVLAFVPLTMLAVTALASYVRARRASRIDVCAALREN